MKNVEGSYESRIVVTRKIDGIQHEFRLYCDESAKQGLECYWVQVKPFVGLKQFFSPDHFSLFCQLEALLRELEG